MAGENRPVRLGLVGCGEVTRAKHLPALKAIGNVIVPAVADLDEQRRMDVAGRFGIARQCSDVEEMLASTDLDAVGVCTSPGAHTEIAIAAMRAGKHVWIDKPLALTGGECLRMMAEAARNRVVAMTGFHMRFHRLVAEARELLRQGAVGAVESVRVVWHSPRGDGTVPEWKMHRGAGGGALIELAVHQFDLIRYLLDSEIDEIFAFGRDSVRDDEAAVLCARMCDGVLIGGEFSERAPHEIEIVVSGRYGMLRLDCLQYDGLELRGTREAPGMPAVRLRKIGRSLRCLPVGLGVMRRGGDYRDSYRLAWRGFIDAVRTGREPGATLRDGWRAVQAAGAAVESRLTGARVSVPRLPEQTLKPGTAGDPPGGLTFSVVIPTYNRPHHVRGILQALQAQTFPHGRFEVILVDDGGSAPLEDILASYSDRLQVKLLKQPNAGCGPARQSGVEAARGAYLAFTDDDCRPAACWLSRLAAALNRQPGCAVAGPTVNGLRANVYAEASQAVVNRLSEWEGGFAPTSNLAFPAAEFRAVGGLNSTWHMAGGEDRDLCARWTAAGFHLFRDAGAEVDHYHRLGLGSFLRQHFNYGRGALLFHRRARDIGMEGYACGRWRFYMRLLRPPGREQGVLRAARLILALALSQAATAAGLLAEAARGALHGINPPAAARRQAQRV